MNGFQKEENGIYRLTVPFEAIYTTVFALTNSGKWMLCDTATNELDVKNYILPALCKLGATPDYIFVSHSHKDHSGGLEALIKAFPNAKIITEPTVVFDRFCVISLKGHSKDSLAVFDKETKTLLSFDCLQQRGIDKYVNGISDKVEYLKSIEKVRSMEVERIIFSHDYVPCGYSARGKSEIENALNVCRDYILV